MLVRATFVQKIKDSRQIIAYTGEVIANHEPTLTAVESGNDGFSVKSFYELSQKESKVTA
ncbi:hypothetical protein [Pseudalkalibacillus berkeleyi]|uniref:Uncharacterized protein n=1 Tax=Pseudalkalibacillus berkeleyi TaxID=1069813 RepID=A0ABS9GZ84_9BACL|nr:hypothetical protein [Pseudalkalibacillus berkeleyi]MCF6136705.1 hypothetical protein [Pseudalkalibacillus berkeleyi]